MIFEICAILAILIFLVLTYFIIRTLLSIQKSLTRLNNIAEEITIKSLQLDPLFNSLENVGDILEEKSEAYRENSIERRNCSCACKHNDSSNDLENLLIASYKLCAHYLRRR